MKNFNKINSQARVSQRFLKAIPWEKIYYSVLNL